MSAGAGCAVLLLSAAAAAWVAPRTPSIRGRPARPSASVWGRPRSDLTRRPVRLVMAVVAGLTVLLVFQGVLGLVLAAVTAVACVRLLDLLPTRSAQRQRLRLHADLPLAGDLLAAALTAGAAQGPALAAVGRAVGGPLGVELTRVARALDLGAPAASAWARLLDDPVSAVLARPLVRAAERGAAPAAILARVGLDLRRAARDRAVEASEVLAVRAVGPLGACFLPAFVLLGVVPLVAGTAVALLA